jgi:hypothetical protein
VVWNWLADPELRRQWFAAGTRAEAPGPFELQFDHDRLSAEPAPCPEACAKHKGAVRDFWALHLQSIAAVKAQLGS